MEFYLPSANQFLPARFPIHLQPAGTGNSWIIGQHKQPDFRSPGKCDEPVVHLLERGNRGVMPSATGDGG